MKRWNKAINSVTALEQQDAATKSSALLEEHEAHAAMLEPSIRFTNLKQKLLLISRKQGAKSAFNLEAMADLVEEARFNKSAIVDEAAAAQELKKLLTMPGTTRRALHLREITEFGRKLELPAGWHGSDRMRTAVWYNILQRLKLTEFEEGQVVLREGQQGNAAYWILSGEAAVRETAMLQAQEAAAAAAKAAAEAAAIAAAALAEAEAKAAADHAARESTFGTLSRTGTGRGSMLRRSRVQRNSGGEAQSRAGSRGADKLASPQTMSRISRVSVVATKPSNDGKETTPRDSKAGGHNSLKPSVSFCAPRKLSLGLIQSPSQTDQPQQGTSPRLIGVPSGTNEPSSPTAPAARLPPQAARVLAARAVRNSSSGGRNSQRGSTSGSGNAWLGVNAAGQPAPADYEADDFVLGLWDMFGEDALQNTAHTYNVVAKSKLVCAALTLEEYQAVLDLLQGESFESLKPVYLMLMNRAQRTPQELQDLAEQLSVFGLFKNMDQGTRLEVCNLVEFIYCPAGFTLFEEGDRVDFCYLVLQGQVMFTKYDDKARRQEELGVKATGDHFGTLLTLSAGEKKRPFTAVASQACELAVISRVGYTRILKQQLQGAIRARVELFRELAVMRSNTNAALQRIATTCQDEIFPAGSMVLDPGNSPTRIFFIMEGEAKLVWVTDQPHTVPKDDQDKAAASLQANSDDDQVAEKTQKDTTLSVQQQLGATTFTSGPKFARRRHTIEVAHLMRGDVINGAVLLGVNSRLHVFAVSQVKLVSLELENIESALGRESTRMLRELVGQQHDWAKQRLQQVVEVRQAVGQHIMEASQHRAMQNTELRHFMDHYVPHSAWELAHQQQRQHQASNTDDSGAVAPGGRPTALPASLYLPQHKIKVASTRVHGVQSLDQVLQMPSSTVKGINGLPGGRKRHRQQSQASEGMAGQPNGEPSTLSIGAASASSMQQASSPCMSHGALGMQPSLASFPSQSAACGTGHGNVHDHCNQAKALLVEQSHVTVCSNTSQGVAGPGLNARPSYSSLQQQPSYASLQQQPSYTSLQQQPSYTSLQQQPSVPGLWFQPSQASVGTAVSGGTAAHAAELAGIEGGKHHLGTAVSVNAKRKKGRHMAFAGGVSTVILDLTTEPSLPAHIHQHPHRHQPDSLLHNTPGRLDTEESCSRLQTEPESAQQGIKAGLKKLEIPTTEVLMGLSSSNPASTRSTAAMSTALCSPRKTAGNQQDTIQLNEATQADTTACQHTAQHGSCGSVGDATTLCDSSLAAESSSAAILAATDSGQGESVHADQDCIPDALQPRPPEPTAGMTDEQPIVGHLILDPGLLFELDPTIEYGYAAPKGVHQPIFPPDHPFTRLPAAHAVHAVHAVLDSTTPEPDEDAATTVPEPTTNPTGPSRSLPHAPTTNSTVMSRATLTAVNSEATLPSIMAAPSVKSCGGTSTTSHYHPTAHPHSASPLPRLPNAPSPLLVSPALGTKVLLQRPSSPKTAHFAQQRSAAIISSYLTPDGEVTSHQQQISTQHDYKASTNNNAHNSRHHHKTATRHAPGSLSQSAPAGAFMPPDGDLEVYNGVLQSEASVVILPQMMNVYQSVLTTKQPMLRPLGKHYKPKSSSPPRPHWSMTGRASSAGHARSEPGRSRSPTAHAHDRRHEPPSEAHADTDNEQPSHEPHHSMSLKTLSVSLRALANVDKPLPGGTVNRSVTRRGSRMMSRRISSMRGSEGAMPTVVRVIATANMEQEPSLPLDFDRAAPQLNDHTISRPNLDDITYILHRWGNRWSTNREHQLQERVKEGKELPAGLSPRTAGRVLDVEHSAWDEQFKRNLEGHGDQFAWPVAKS